MRHNSVAPLPVENPVHLPIVSSQRQLQLSMLASCHLWAKAPGVFALGLDTKTMFTGSSS